jgi:chemotaxis protein methyltransferase CheR
MTTPFDSLGLSGSAAPLLRDLIHERIGLFFDNGRCDMLTDRLAPLVVERGFQSLLDYYYLLKYDDDARTEWPRVMDALSVSETYFWREIDQVRAVVNVVVPALVAAQPDVPVRIWSIPCASGEEPLTIAMALDQAGWFSRARFEIHGSDASEAAVARARAGRFRERSFRILPPALRERYFSRAGDEWAVDPELHARIRSWSVVNLMDAAQVAPMARAAVIFCRNVFIYFSEKGIRQVSEVFARHMPAPGYLCVGASESLLRVTTRFQLEEMGGAFIYVKRA